MLSLSFQLLLERRVLSVEVLYHPVSSLWHCQDGGETTAICTNWSQTMHGAKHRQQLVQIVRLTKKHSIAAIAKSNLHRGVVLIENIHPRLFNLPKSVQNVEHLPLSER